MTSSDLKTTDEIAGEFLAELRRRGVTYLLIFDEPTNKEDSWNYRMDTPDAGRKLPGLVGTADACIEKIARDHGMRRTEGGGNG